MAVIHITDQEQLDEFYSQGIGFILNNYKNCLHEVSCPHYSSNRPSIAYTKVCFEAPEDVLNHLGTDGPSSWYPCPTCEPHLSIKAGRTPIGQRRYKQASPDSTGVDSELASRIVAKLGDIYESQVVPEMIREFTEWGFSRDALKSDWHLLHPFLVLAAYDRQPYTRRGGYELIWTETGDSLRSVLARLELLSPERVQELGLENVDERLKEAKYAGLSLRADRGANTESGTVYAKTITQIAATAKALHTRILRVRYPDDPKNLHEAFIRIHGIGPVIASKLCKYLLRELRLSSVDTKDLGACISPILKEYHNSLGYKEMCAIHGAAVMKEAVHLATKSDDPCLVDALFFIHRRFGSNGFRQLEW